MSTTLPLKDRLDLPTVEALRTRKKTNREVAAELGVSETHLSRVLAEEGITKERGETIVARQGAAALFESRKELRTKLATKVNAGRMTVAKAAEEANCDERTIWRYVAKVKKAEIAANKIQRKEAAAAFAAAEAAAKKPTQFVPKGRG